MTEDKCKDCQWLTGKRTIIGVECMQPQKQERWKQLDYTRAGINGRKTTARYKQPSALACKKFERKGNLNEMKEIIVRYKDGADYMSVKGGEYIRDLVRCKDCRHGIVYDDDEPFCNLHQIGIYTDDFCSYGEPND